MTSVERLAVINGTGDGGSSFATNLGRAEDYTDPLFLDRAKASRGWQTQAQAAYTSANLDSEGALSSLVSGDTQATYFFCSASDTAGIIDGPPVGRGGRFRATFTGAATITGGLGITGLTQINANTYEFDCDWNGNKWLTFTPTAFPIKVAIVKTTDVAAYDAGEIFRQEFLDSLPSGGCFRFMDWMLTNNSPLVNWSEYPVRAAQRWNRVPFEVMLSLCTAKSATPWFCIPHQASDAFITSMATYVRDNFAGKVRFEYSNEIWNTGTFNQGSWLKGQAEAVWGVADGYTNPSGSWLQYGGKRFAQAMQIINTVFAGQTSRVIGVIGAQAASANAGNSIADATLWQTYEPGAYVRPSTLAKEISIAPYINWAEGGATVQGNNIKAQLDISQAAAVAYIKGMIPASLAQAKGWIDGSMASAADRNLRLTMYEYNNHYDLFATSASTLYSGGAPVPGAETAMYEATFSQEMADAQDELRSYFKSRNGSLMTFYVDTGGASRFGTWGAKTHLAHNSPIWNGLVSWHTANPRWWAQ